MNKHLQVADLVKQAYEQSEQAFAHWMWENHVPLVAKKSEELAQKYGANEDQVVAGA